MKGMITVSDKRVLLILPALIILFFNSIFPTLIVVNYSFQEPFAAVLKFVGWDNYIQVLQDPAFLAAFRRNVYFSSVTLVIEILLGLALALIIRERGKFASIVSAAIILPSLIPYVSIGILWRLLAMTNGPLSLILKLLGINYSLMSGSSSFWTIIIMDVWHWTSLVFLLVSAGLMTIPDVYYTAARVDGAKKWQTFRLITMPGLKPMLILVTLLRIIDSFKIYDENVILTGGGPGRSTEFLSVFLVKKILKEWAGGFGAAASLIYLVQVIVICYVIITLLTRGRGMLERPIQ
jgi:glycerol transport system permease protein